MAAGRFREDLYSRICPQEHGLFVENLSVAECDEAMKGIVFDRWSRLKGWKRRRREDTDRLDLSEAPLAYKDIDEVVAAELDLVEPVVKLAPLGVIKG